jgi:hypothetical protein
MPSLEDPRFILALGLFLAVVGAVLGFRVARWWRGRAAARARRLGRRGARIAEKLLRRGGYVVLQREVSAPMRLIVDGAPRSYPVRADALVARGDQVFVAEFKGGEEVSRLSHRGTRRQLLEYAHAFGVRGILLVDAYRRRIHEVGFELATEDALELQG